jgi:hypothetical protein
MNNRPNRERGFVAIFASFHNNAEDERQGGMGFSLIDMAGVHFE